MKDIVKKKAVRRLRIVAGQVKGLERMIENDKYCVDIITQSLAVKEALSGVENLILENHLETHVVEQIRSGRKSKAVGEILKIHKLSKSK